MTLHPTSPSKSRPNLIWIGLGVVAVVIALVMGLGALKPKPPKDPYRTAPVERGPITKSVSASGSLEALVTVDVGSQISGQITRVLVDFNDEVSSGQVLAIIDPQTYQSRVFNTASP